MHDTRLKRPGEDVFGLVFLVLSVGLFWQSYAIAGFSSLSSPGAFPLAASGAMVIAAIVVVAGNLRRGHETSGPAILPAQVAIFVGLVLAYALLLAPLGFLPASFLFLFAGMKLLYRGGWLASAVISVLALAVVYVVFRLVFQVVLPEGVVPEGEWRAAVRGLFGEAE